MLTFLYCVFKEVIPILAYKLLFPNCVWQAAEQNIFSNFHNAFATKCNTFTFIKYDNDWEIVLLFSVEAIDKDLKFKDGAHFF